MAKEPKLLAEIRKARERAENAPPHAPPAPVGPLMSATVETPAVRQPPNNYITQALADCTTAEQCEELLEHAEAHGYDRNGQTVKLIRERLNDLGWKPPKRRGAR